MKMKKLKIITCPAPNSFTLSRKAFCTPSFKMIAAILILLFTSTSPLSAAVETERKNRLIIYNFQTLKPAPEEIKKGKKPGEYEYYSIILPETISKKLQESERFIINRGSGFLLDNKADSIDTIRANYIGELSYVAKETASDYVIAGQFEVKKSILNVRIFIYNARLNDLQEVTASEAETGLYLKDTIDSLSEDIEEKIKDIIVEQQDKGKKKKEEYKYPFYILAKPLEYTSIGLDAGYIYMSGKWQDTYNNSEYYSPYIAFDILSFLDITFKFDYFNTDSDHKTVLNYSSMNVMGGSALLGLKYQIFSNLGIYLTAGGGVARSEISIKPGGPFEASLSKRKFTDPAAEAGLGIKLNISSIYVRSGVTFKRIHFKDDPMDLRIIYGGAGIHF